jgi:hypothetical protein
MDDVGEAAPRADALRSPFDPGTRFHRGGIPLEFWRVNAVQQVPGTRLLAADNAGLSTPTDRDGFTGGEPVIGGRPDLSSAAAYCR